ncbi:Gfo/Idh/MocA family protein [Flavihumibacter sp. UBA7668]|uniref:Gfo/Idh/MocA family protein n=1 Tax=Flavihumibacter sp. UBA7668 TaxID=1946542 RepID=UPI0025C0B92F|nr:Gfo/Idh/MocA family oxidoreductase [Flavihumibacter sp. UBA7668]
MKNTTLNRKSFILQSSLAGIALAMPTWMMAGAVSPAQTGKRIGIIGLDTSHSIAFAKWFNRDQADGETGGFKVVAAYPQGSLDIVSSTSRIPANTEEIKKYGVSIASSIAELLNQVDVVCLETNDGRRHLEQAIEVFQAGKTVFIDKPVTASLKDAISLYEAAEKYKVPVFSSSSLRYTANTKLVAKGDFGSVLGADTYSPATIEKTHPDLFWYGIHGVEMLYAVLGTGCRSVYRSYSPDADLVIGEWADGRIGTFRGTRKGKADFGGTAFCEKANVQLGPFAGYISLLEEIVRFFQTGIAPVSPKETIELIAFMEAADKSRKKGKAIRLSV